MGKFRDHGQPGDGSVTIGSDDPTFGNILGTTTTTTVHAIVDMMMMMMMVIRTRTTCMSSSTFYWKYGVTVLEVVHHCRYNIVLSTTTLIGSFTIQIWIGMMKSVHYTGPELMTTTFHLATCDF